MTACCHGVRYSIVSELEKFIKTIVITYHPMPLYFNSILCAHANAHTCHSVQVEVRGQPTMSVPSIHLMDPKDQIQISDLVARTSTHNGILPVFNAFIVNKPPNLFFKFLKRQLQLCFSSKNVYYTQ